MSESERAGERESTQRVETLHASPAVGPIRVTVYGATDVGLVREHNEDNFTFADLSTRQGAKEAAGSVLSASLGERGFFAAVCDGMGGAAAGEVASQMGVDTLLERLGAEEPTEDREVFARRLIDAIQEAGGRIFGAAKMDRARRGMGTTSTVAGLIDKVLFVGQVGDSRAYVCRQGELGLITKDQSLVNQLIEAGQLTEEEAEHFEHSNIILQALGTTERVTVDLTFLELRQGDRLMLCSDGLTGLVHARAIGEVLASIKDPVAAAKSLIEMANTAGGHDNITCVIVDFDGEGLAPAVGGQRPAYQQYPLPPEGQSAPREGQSREPSIKTQTQKPGADVKRGNGQDRASLRGRSSRGRGILQNPLVAFVLALVIVLAGALAFGLFSDDATPVRRGEGEVAPQPEVEIRITSDIDGATLFIDGKNKGPLPDSFDTDITPGPHRFEARVGDEIVAQVEVRVRPGVEGQRIELTHPEGVDEYDDELDDEDEDPAAPSR